MNDADHPTVPPRSWVGLDAFFLEGLGGVFGPITSTTCHRRTFVVAAPLLATTADPEGEPDPIDQFEVVERPLYSAAVAAAGPDWDPI